MGQETKNNSSEDRVERLEIYKLMVEMADRVSQRRQAANSFYLTINTLLIGGSSYLGSLNSESQSKIAISVCGILVSIYWLSSIESYKTLNTAKFDVINSIEKSFIVKPFTEEWEILDPDKDGIRHKPFHQTEKVVPKIFIALYIFQIPWEVIFEMFHIIPWKNISMFLPNLLGKLS